MVYGLRDADVGQPDYHRALLQHDAYIEALISCGLEVTILPADEKFPDSVFIEDTALLTPSCAVITRPGASSRREETVATEASVKTFYENTMAITSPGTLDAGDVMMVETHFYIGLSKRTNKTGAEQLIAILNEQGYSGSTVKLDHVLHLKTGVVYLDRSTLVSAGEFNDKFEFEKFNHIQVDPTEQYAANCVWINGKVLVAEGYPLTRKKIESTGYETIALEMSEFRKLDGGLSCLSLRF